MTVAAEQPLDEQAPRREPRRSGLLGDVLVVLGSFAVLAVVCGVLWWLLVDPATFTKGPNGAAMGELELGKRFNPDGWYTVIGAVAAFLAGVWLTWWRDRDLRATTVLLVLGSGVAAAVMDLTGRLLGPGNPDAAFKAAEVGEKIPVELVVTAPAVYLVWPIGALIGALMVLWSPPKDQGRADWAP